MLVLSVFLFALIAWLGLYLLAREAANSRLCWIGGGLLIYDLIFASQVVMRSAYMGWLCTIGSLLLLLDVGIARKAVLALGEAFWPDFIHSLDAAALFALIFGAPVVLTMVLATGSTGPMLSLLLCTLTLAMASQIFGESLQQWLDQLAFATFPRLRQQRAELRATLEVLPKIDETINLNTWNETEFIRFTRRALSHYGDLPHLAANPLTRLPLIYRWLEAHQDPANTLERAAELKRLLQEAILKLKPNDDAAFNPSEAWRHYNALYFPYVVGLKPYSRRAEHTNLDATSQQALYWLRAQVPERTLHNWQNAAAKLVAQYLQEL
ncbi:hypothetical protein BH10CHL1_BH10CHL1_44640 [soil metagenome]